MIAGSIREIKLSYQDKSKGGITMKHKGAIEHTVFDSIYTTISGIEDIHQDSEEIKGENIKSRTQDLEHNGNGSTMVKSASGKVERIVLSFFK
jgi:hypothetical protein